MSFTPDTPASKDVPTTGTVSKTSPEATAGIMEGPDYVRVDLFQSDISGAEIEAELETNVMQTKGIVPAGTIM